MTHATMTQTTAVNLNSVIANVLALKSMAAKTASEMNQRAQAVEPYPCAGCGV